MGSSSTLTAFRSPAAFRAWLARHHASAKELLVRCYKVHAKDKGITYGQALDEALCFGWIDGVRRSVDSDSFSQRFSPRKARSAWSAVNIKRVRKLRAEGRMRPAGLAAFGARSASNSRRYSYESRPRGLAPAHARKLRANPRARAFFDAQPPWYKRSAIHWVISAKREETRDRRFRQLLGLCVAKRRLMPLGPAERNR